MKMEGIVPILLVVISYVQSEDVIVTTPVGDIKGLTNSFKFAGQDLTASAFLGIPYAESTDGTRRFAKPVKKEPFDGVYDATEQKPACLQNLQWTPGLDIPMSEDCLTLNIFAPSGAKNGDSKAVMIFIYGGGFQFGFQSSYVTGTLSALYDVIFVTLNYRVSAHGFLASRKHGLKGNYGLWDQHMGIKWVHDNIASFGGDPNAVTIFGESAGAVSVIYQALYKGNQGMFQRVIAQSGAAGATWGYNKYPDMLYDQLVKEADCQNVDCLRDLSVTDLQNAIEALPFGDMYLPVKDGEFIKYDPASLFKNNTKESADALKYFAEKDVIIGLNSDEGYSESMLFMYIYGEDLGQLNDGVTQTEMERFIGQMLKYNNKTSNDIVLMSIMHQYTDWSDPKNPDALRAKYYQMVKDVQYTTSSIQMLDLHASAGEPGHTFMYHFEHKPSFSKTPAFVSGADHGDELAFVFGFPNVYMYAFEVYSDDAASTVSANELALSRDIMQFWTQFAKSGNPNDPAEGSPEQWPQYENVNQTYIRFFADVEQFPTGNYFRSEYVNYWEELFPVVANISTRHDKDKEPCVVGAASILNVSYTLLMASVSMIMLAF